LAFTHTHTHFRPSRPWHSCVFHLSLATHSLERLCFLRPASFFFTLISDPFFVVFQRWKRS
jgi:hypothetical protein